MRASTKPTKSLAKSLASGVLDNVGFPHSFDKEDKPPAVPLRKIARSLEVPISKREPDSILRPDGALWERRVEQPSLFGDYEAEIWTQSVYQYRFTLAHELAHRAVSIYLSKDQTGAWTNKDWKEFLDGFAGQLLLPNSLLVSFLPTDSPLELSLKWLDDAHRKFKVSIACLLTRLNEAAHDGLIQVSNCALIAVASVSAKRKTEYAPRVLSSCSPRRWFIPANKRLSSLGLLSLSKLFWKADPLVEGVAEDRPVMWRREDWSKVSANRMVRFVLYPTREGQQRILLATFRAPDDNSTDFWH